MWKSRPEFKEALEKRLRQLGYGENSKSTDRDKTPTGNFVKSTPERVPTPLRKSPSVATIYTPAVRSYEDTMKIRIPSANVTEQMVAQQLDKLRLANFRKNTRQGCEESRNGRSTRIGSGGGQDPVDRTTRRI